LWNKKSNLDFKLDELDDAQASALKIASIVDDEAEIDYREEVRVEQAREEARVEGQEEIRVDQA